MKNRSFLIGVLAFLSILFFTQLAFLSHPVTDNDEGIYSTSFLLMKAGFPAYKQTFFSQPPGFILSVYPGFLLFGKTLLAARLTIMIWSFLGLLAIFWIGYELKNKWASLLTISFLFLIPYYFNQTVVLQSDILISSFSLISLAAFTRYLKSFDSRWFILSSFFLNLAFWTKFDISLFFPFLLTVVIFLRTKNISHQILKKMVVCFLATGLTFFLLALLPFGLKEILTDVILLRTQAAALPNSSHFLDFLRKNNFLFFIFILYFSLLFLRKENFRLPQLLFISWTLIVTILMIVYRPLFPHHLAVLTVPLCLSFSYLISNYLKKNKKVFIGLCIFFVLLSTLNRLYLLSQSSNLLLSNEQQKAVTIIEKETSPHDLVLSDEAVLNSVSGRLPPPALSDVSYVRIQSSNLSAENFKTIIDATQPKLIIAWNGRLRSITTFDEVIQGYTVLYSFSDSRKVYIHKEK